MDVTIGSRKSKLALWQTEFVAAMLQKNGISTLIKSMETIGDKVLDTSIAKIGSKGVFTEELEEQLRSGETDIAVHSAKDMQSTLPDDFELIAFTERERVNDVVISHRKDLPLDAPNQKLRIGTSSVRRVALLHHYYPNLIAVEMRGNLQTRIRKMEEGACDALMLAYAGVFRMGYQDMIVKIFPETQFIPPVGQGCIAIEASKRLDPAKRAKIRECLNNSESEMCLRAERAYLKKLEGGCSIPAFALATQHDGQLVVNGGLSSLDGTTILRKSVQGATGEAEQLGLRLAEAILQEGGREILAEIKRHQNK